MKINELLEYIDGLVARSGTERLQAYEEIVALIKNQPTITERDIHKWGGEIQYSVQTHEDWGYVEDFLKEMLTELGVTIDGKVKQ